jgi:hypothetical protein
MKRLLLAFVLLLAAAQSALGEPSASTIPLTLTRSDYDGGRIYLPVRLGNALGSMRLDTGASTSRVALAPWNKDFPRIGASHSTGASGQAALCDDVEARNVQLRASEGNGVARGKYELTRCPTNDGDDLLGVDFFKGTRFLLDFDRRQMVLFGASQEGHPAPFRPLGDGRLIGLPVRVGDVATLGLFDTGAEISAVDQRFVDAHRKLFTPVKSRLKASAAGGGRFTSKLYKVRQIAFGDGRAVKGVYVLAYDFGPLREALGPDVAFILGYNFVSRFNWEIDLTNPASPGWLATARK